MSDRYFNALWLLAMFILALLTFMFTFIGMCNKGILCQAVAEMEFPLFSISVNRI